MAASYVSSTNWQQVEQLISFALLLEFAPQCLKNRKKRLVYEDGRVSLRDCFLIHVQYVRDLHANGRGRDDAHVIREAQSSYFYYIGLVVNELNYMKKMREMVIMMLESIDFLINKGRWLGSVNIIRILSDI